MKTYQKYVLIALTAVLLVACSTNTPFATAVPKHKVFRSDQQEAAYRIDTLLNSAATSMGWWGVKVLYPETGEVIYERNASKVFMPASNMKMYSTAAAICLLGPQYRYATDFVTNGSISDGELKGDLIIKGSGDPTWYKRFYDGNYDSVMVRFVDSLRAQGIERIDGNIIGDDNVFDDNVYGNGWEFDDEPYYYCAQLSGLSFNENYIDFSIMPDSANLGQPVIIEPLPMTKYMQIKNNLITVDSDTSTKWDYGKERGTNNGWFEGQYRIQSGESEKTIAVENPTLFTVFALKEYLNAAGIAVKGDPIDGDDLKDSINYDETTTLFTYYSHPMSDIITKVNRPSQNFIAETLQKTIGKEFGKEGSSREGIKVQMKLFDSLGVDTENLVLKDGSGLSRHNLIAPNHTASLLQMMWDHPYRSYYIESFPLSGWNGTIGRRMGNSDAYKNVRAKTGTVEFVSSLSGYTWTKSGEPIIFSIMANHFTIPTSKVRNMQNKVCEILSEME